MKKKIGDEIALAGLIRDSFAYSWEMFRVTDFVRWLYEKPNFIRRVIERVTDFNLEVTKQIIDAGVDVFVGDGDYCEKRGPLVPVKFFKDVIFPSLQKQVEVVHKAGLKFIKHTDGNVNPIMPDLARIVDGLHSLDPTASMDIGEIKRVYGEKLVLMGNISVDNLCTKTPQDIIEETKKCLRSAAPGGGFILSSSNSWYANAKIENCQAMIDTGRKYGHYPIEIA
jgi:uroporphyrinogen decarboxylase